MEGLIEILIFLPLVVSPVCYLLGRKNIKTAGILAVAAAGVSMLLSFMAAFFGDSVSAHFFSGVGINFSSEGFRGIFAALCGLAFFLSALASPFYFESEPKTNRYYAFMLITLSATMGVFLSNDLFTTYVFFEVMSLSSWVWVAHSETPEAKKAADTYLAVAVIGGLSLLFGIMLINAELGTLEFSAIKAAVSAGAISGRAFAGGILMLVGFGAKAGMFPLHIWLPASYAAAPAPASALLSAVLSKAGIFGMLLLSAFVLEGNVDYALLILVLGLITMLIGALMALISTDLKRTLACSSLSQIGFIIVGLSMLAFGEEGSIAAAGVITHAINHGLIKTVLFVSAGVLYKNRHTLDLNELRGAGRDNLFLKLCFLAAALSVGGIPLFGGYISKTALHEAIVEKAAFFTGDIGAFIGFAEVLFLFSGGLTLAYMAKLFVKIFVEKSEKKAAPLKMDAATSAAIAIPSALLVVMGVLPGMSYLKIAGRAAESLGVEPPELSPFVLENLKGAAISIAVGVIVYFLIVRPLLTKKGKYIRLPVVFELETHIYRPLLKIGATLAALVSRLVYSLSDWFVWLSVSLTYFRSLYRAEPKEDHHFGRYTRQYVRVGAIRQTLAFELMLFGIGVLVTLVYLLFF